MWHSLYVGNRNMEAGTCSQKYVFSRERNLCYPLLKPQQFVSRTTLGFFMLSRYTVVKIKLVFQGFVFVGSWCVGTSG
jgi:hypothetical protein